MKILLLLTLFFSQFVWAGEYEDYLALANSKGLTGDIRTRFGSRINWIEGKVTMIDDRVNGNSAHYAVVRLTSVKIGIGGGPAADSGVVFNVLKDIENSVSFPPLIRRHYYQGQHCLDMAKQAFASGKRFFIGTGDNGSEMTAAGRWYTDNTMESYIVTEIAGPWIMAPGRCGIMN